MKEKDKKQITEPHMLHHAAFNPIWYLAHIKPCSQAYFDVIPLNCHYVFLPTTHETLY